MYPDIIIYTYLVHQTNENLDKEVQLDNKQQQQHQPQQQHQQQRKPQ